MLIHVEWLEHVEWHVVNMADEQMLAKIIIKNRCVKNPHIFVPPMQVLGTVLTWKPR